MMNTNTIEKHEQGDQACGHADSPSTPRLTSAVAPRISEDMAPFVPGSMDRVTRRTARAVHTSPSQLDATDAARRWAIPAPSRGRSEPDQPRRCPSCTRRGLEMELAIGRDDASSEATEPTRNAASSIVEARSRAASSAADERAATPIGARKKPSVTTSPPCEHHRDDQPDEPEGRCWIRCLGGSRKGSPSRSRGVERTKVLELLRRCRSASRGGGARPRRPRAMPPRAVPSSLVRMTPVTSTASPSSSAWRRPFWPVVASTVRRVSCGASGTCRSITRRTFRSSSIRLCCV